MSPRHSPTLGFDTLRLEGALLLPDLLEKAAQGQASGQAPEDYHVPRGFTLQEEIGRAFRIAQAQWKAYSATLERTDLDATVSARAFVEEFLRDALGYADVRATAPRNVGERSFPLSLQAAANIPVVVAPATLDLDDPDPAFAPQGGGARKKSPFQLLQEYLNAEPEARWGLASNGRKLRLARDAATLTRPSFIEFDLETMLGQARYPDFAALWRLLHASRASRTPEPVWELWRADGQREGARVREGLRIGVEAALVTLGAGFLEHPANEPLRRALIEGRLTRQAYFEELLRLVYRFIFLFAVEERGLLHPADDLPAAAAARRIYDQGYSARRLRSRCLRRVARDAHDDLWQAQRIVFRALAAGEPRLALPALGGLFAPGQCPHLDAASLSNRALLEAMRSLRWSQASGTVAPVDYRNMGPEELGSVYESLLELVPDPDPHARTFAFVNADADGDTKGNARKTTGSYYTPDSLVQELIKSALDPVIDARLSEAGRVASGEWEGVANPYREVFVRYATTKLSGSRHMAAGHATGRGELRTEPQFPERGAFRSDRTDSQSSSLDTGQHRGGLGEALPAGIPPIPAHRQREQNGAGDASAVGGPDRPGAGRTDRSLAGAHDDPGQTDRDPRAQPQPTERELKALWDKTLSTIRHSLFTTHAVLSITVVDPACGSGHFLLAAARRLAERLAALRAPEGAVRAQDYRHALREVITHCIYGVDRNPMALELARFALWLEGFEEGRPLGFLDHHLVCGDALIGITDVGQLAHGIPDAAFKPLSGDDKSVCKLLAKENKEGLKAFARRKRDANLPLALERDTLLAERAALEAMPDDTLAQQAAKDAAWKRYADQARASRLQQAADLFVGAFLSPKAANGGAVSGEWSMANGRKPGASVADHSPLANHHSPPPHSPPPHSPPPHSPLATHHSPVPTSQNVYLALFTDRAPEDLPQARQAQRLAQATQRASDARVLHWPLAFVQVFQKGGFDCVLGNPPWERIKLQEEEFFAAENRLVAQAKNKAERSQRIEWLAQGMLARHLYPELEHAPDEAAKEKETYARFIAARRIAEATSVFAHLKAEEGGRYPLTGVGDVNTYALFAETIYRVTGPHGRAGFIVPTGIATDASTQAYFREITQKRKLVSLFDFDNSERAFPAVATLVRFSLVVLGFAEQATFAFLIRAVPELADERRRFSLTPTEFLQLNPNTLTCPVFRSRRDAELTKKIYARVPVLRREARDGEPEANPWGISFMRMFDMSNDSHLFVAETDLPSNATTAVGDSALSRSFDGYVPLYEAKMMTIFDHRFGSYPPGLVDDTRALPRLSLGEYSDPAFEVRPRFYLDVAEVRKRVPDCRDSWFVCFRSMSNHSNVRRFIAGAIPYAAVGNSLTIVRMEYAIDPKRAACLLSNLSALVLDAIARWKVSGTNLNLFLVEQFPILAPSFYSDADTEFIVRRVIELVFTADSLRGFAERLGYDGRPFPFDPDRRARLRAELDAYYARLYGLTREDLCYILDPASVMGEDYPSETFRVLKQNEMREFGEYRTQRLVLEAWDALERGALT